VKIPRHLLIAATGWGSRIVGAVVQIALIRVIVRTLGADQYAAFAVLYALSTWFLLADLGLGFSLQNALSERKAHGKAYGGLIRKVISVVFGILSLELVVLAALSNSAANRLLYQFPFLSSQSKWILFFTACCLLLIAGVGQLSYKIWYGEQKGYLSNIIPALSQLIGLGAVCATIHFSRSMESIIVAYLLPPAVVGFACLTKLWLRTAEEQPDGDKWWPPLLRKAAGFGAFGVAGAFVLQVDLIIVSQFLPPRQIATYAVISRIFSFVFLIYSSALLALWPVCSEHLARNNWAPVQRYVRYYIIIGSLFVAAFTLLIAAEKKTIVSVVAPGGALEVPLGSILLFGALYLVRVWTDTFAMVLQSKSMLLPLWISTPIQALLSVLFQILLIPRLGLSGAILGVIGSFLLTASWILPVFVFKSFGRMRTTWPEKVMENEIIGLHSDL
jgi:O-antigen/teichoic acid export membrane protein